MAERRKRAARRAAARDTVLTGETPGPRRSAARPGDAALVVATYNIHKCVGVDRRHDPARIAAVLRELDADIICLQEVVARRDGPRPLDQEAFLGEAMGMRVISGPQRNDHRGRMGNAILTSLPVLAIRHIDLSIAGYEPRGALDVDLDAKGRPLRVVATHLGLRGAERQAQTQRLLAALANGDGRVDGADEAILMMGDLNEWRGRRGGIRALDRAFGRAPAPRTFPSWCPVLPLDRIYIAPPVELVHFAVHRSPLARLASDHLPLRAHLAWRAAS
ncbi:MAG: endonuclease/exonuclease/phosphatase family protein [Alphaproteobacteria bacterium]|nr:endonuclease/exonuclease/phosphatase family protein [Alphaproteobacteria bacterium]